MTPPRCLPLSPIFVPPNLSAFSFLSTSLAFAQSVSLDLLLSFPAPRQVHATFCPLKKDFTARHDSFRSVPGQFFFFSARCRQIRFPRLPPHVRGAFETQPEDCVDALQIFFLMTSILSLGTTGFFCFPCHQWSCDSFLKGFFSPRSPRPGPISSNFFSRFFGLLRPCSSADACAPPQYPPPFHLQGTKTLSLFPFWFPFDPLCLWVPHPNAGWTP